MKPYRHGLVAGKFMPLHPGHMLLIDTALSQCETVHILVGSLAHEPVDGHLRYEWVCETYPQAHVVHSIEDSLPPWDAPDYWERWVALTRGHYPQVDAVFTSEPYGDVLAQLLGAIHVSVDPARQAVPVSATAIRHRPLRHWDHLAPACRPYFARRVLVYGPMSTGKTALCEHLAAHFNTTWVTEFARDYLAANGNRFDRQAALDIVEGQLFSEEESAVHCDRLLFCDTDPLLTRVYMDEYGLGPVPLYVRRLANERRYDLYLFTAIDLPWHDDGTRERGDRRPQIRDRLLQALISRRIPYHRIIGTGPERFALAVAVVEEHLARWNEEGIAG